MPFAVPLCISLDISPHALLPRLSSLRLSYNNKKKFIDRWLENWICLFPRTHTASLSLHILKKPNSLPFCLVPDWKIFFSSLPLCTQFSSFQNFQPLCCWSFALLRIEKYLVYRINFYNFLRSFLGASLAGTDINFFSIAWRKNSRIVKKGNLVKKIYIRKNTQGNICNIA